MEGRLSSSSRRLTERNNLGRASVQGGGLKKDHLPRGPKGGSSPVSRREGEKIEASRGAGSLLVERSRDRKRCDRPGKGSKREVGKISCKEKRRKT